MPLSIQIKDIGVRTYQCEKYANLAIYLSGDKIRTVIIEQERPVDSDISEGHFNILKLHVMTHYAQHIHQYDSADNIDTEHSEATHKFLVKAFFSQTNKHKSFQQQLLLHNICHLNLTAMKNLIL